MEEENKLKDEIKKLKEQDKINKRNFQFEKSELMGENRDLKKKIENLEFSLIAVIDKLTEKIKQEVGEIYAEEEKRYRGDY